MAFKLTVYPGGPDVSGIKGKKSTPDDAGVFELVCDDDQLEAFKELGFVPGLSFMAIAEEPKKKAPKKAPKKKAKK